jgi:WD40 repeat protein
MDVETGKILHQLPKSRGTVDCLDFSSDGCLLAFGGSDRIVRIWDVHRGAQIRELRGHQHAIIGIAFSNDGNALRSIDARGRVKLWDPNRDQAMQILHVPAAHAVFTRGGRHVAVSARPMASTSSLAR